MAPSEFVAKFQPQNTKEKNMIKTLQPKLHLNYDLDAASFGPGPYENYFRTRPAVTRKMVACRELNELNAIWNQLEENLLVTAPYKPKEQIQRPDYNNRIFTAVPSHMKYKGSGTVVLDAEDLKRYGHSKEQSNSSSKSDLKQETIQLSENEAEIHLKESEGAKGHEGSSDVNLQFDSEAKLQGQSVEKNGTRNNSKFNVKH